MNYICLFKKQKNKKNIDGYHFDSFSVAGKNRSELKGFFFHSLYEKWHKVSNQKQHIWIKFRNCSVSQKKETK